MTLVLLHAYSLLYDSFELFDSKLTFLKTVVLRFWSTTQLGHHIRDSDDHGRYDHIEVTFNHNSKADAMWLALELVFQLILWG
jgi:hypothetical protein